MERDKKMGLIKLKTLVSILRESELYITMTHEEKIALLFRLVRDYPCLSITGNRDEA